MLLIGMYAVKIIIKMSLFRRDLDVSNPSSYCYCTAEHDE